MGRILLVTGARRYRGDPNAGGPLRLPIEEGELSKIALLARVPAAKTRQFERLLRNAVDAAWRAHDANRAPPRAGKVLPYFNRLRKALEPMREGQLGEEAGIILAATAARFQMTADDLFNVVERAILNVTENPETKMKRKGAPKGSRWGGTYDTFLLQLFSASEICGFKWSHYKAQDGEITGTLPGALRIISRFLPPHFMPKNERTLLNATTRARENIKDRHPE